MQVPAIKNNRTPGFRLQWTYILIPAVIVFSIFFYSINLFTSLSRYDESIMLLNSSNIYQGFAPYKDFWTLYMPGYYYFLAGIFNFFGTNTLPARIVDLCFRFLLSIEIYFISKHFVGKKIALIPFLLSVLWLSSIGYYLHPFIPAMMLLMLAFFCLLNFLDNNNTQAIYWLVMCGFLTGIVFATRWDFGVFSLVSFSSGIFFESFYSSSLKTIKESLFKSLRSVFFLSLSTSIVVIPFLLYIGINSGFQLFWNEAFFSPIMINHDFRYISAPALSDFALNPLANIDWIQFYFPAVVTLIQLGQLAYYFKESIFQPQKIKIHPTKATRLFVISVLSLCSLLYSSSRYDFLHILPAQLFGSILFSSLFVDFYKITKKKEAFTFGFIACLILLFFYLVSPYILVPALKYYNVAADVAEHPLCSSNIERAGCAAIDADTEKIVAYIQSVTQENEPIFVGNTHHDKIFTNDLSLYFLTNRKAPNEYQELYPGVATTFPVQEKIVLSLENNHVNYVVLVDIQDSIEANLSSKGSGATYLDNYIKDNYLPVFQAGLYIVMKKKPI